MEVELNGRDKELMRQVDDLAHLRVYLVIDPVLSAVDWVKDFDPIPK